MSAKNPQAKNHIKVSWAKAFIPAFIVAIIIFMASSIPGTNMPTVMFPYFDKIEHMAIYAVLSAAVARGFCNWRPWFSLRLIIILSVMIGTAYGISDEIHQSFVPGRESDIYDIIADAVGSLLGAVSFALIRSRISQA